MDNITKKGVELVNHLKTKINLKHINSTILDKNFVDRLKRFYEISDDEFETIIYRINDVKNLENTYQNAEARYFPDGTLEIYFDN